MVTGSPIAWTGSCRRYVSTRRPAPPIFHEAPPADGARSSVCVPARCADTLLTKENS